MTLCAGSSPEAPNYRHVTPTSTKAAEHLVLYALSYAENHGLLKIAFRGARRSSEVSRPEEPTIMRLPKHLELPLAIHQDEIIHGRIDVAARDFRWEPLPW